MLWVYLRLPETIVHYKSAFHGDFHIFEKNRFFQVQNLAKKMKIASLETKVACIGLKYQKVSHRGVLSIVTSMITETTLYQRLG